MESLSEGKTNFNSSGKFDFQGRAAVNLGPIQLASAVFELGNENPSNTTQFTFGAAWNFIVFSGSVKGTIGVISGCRRHLFRAFQPHRNDSLS